MEQLIRIAMVDDHQLFRKGIESILRASGTIDVACSAGSGDELLEWLTTAAPLPDVVMLDIEMPGLNGIQVTEHLCRAYPQLRIIILSMHFRENLISGLVEKGVHCFLPKNSEPEELLAAIHTVHRNDFYFNDAVLQAIHKSMGGAKKRAPDVTFGFGITAREKEVLELICREYSTAQIAEKLFLSARTVDGHRNNLLQKTGAANTAGLVLFAVRNRIIDPWF